ncbi:MAG: hypothetical protein ABI051_01940 [Vicinamibacterales bacterium]
MTERRPVRDAVAGALICAGILAVPLLWRPVLHAFHPAEGDQPSYLPALERSRPRYPFQADVVPDLQRYPPGIVTIGDSMAGRIDGDLLHELSHEDVSPLILNSTGSAYWYLVFKNYVVASGTHPKWVFVFFRDTNLTDVLFRLDGPYRATLDAVAHDREDELNHIVAARTQPRWHTVHQLADRAYEGRRGRDWLVPLFTDLPARVVAPGGPVKLLEAVNRAFTLDKLRPMAQADIAAADARDADFGANVDASVLPLMLSLAREHGLRLCFVRVLRRPVNGAPPSDPPVLQHYVRDLREYIERRGAVLLDDREEPELALLPYADGDHIAREARRPYTERFWARVSSLKP